MNNQFKIAVGLVMAVCIYHTQVLAAGPSEDVESLFSVEEDLTSAIPEQKPPDKAKTQVKQFSDLSKLEPFEDIAVIQRRYLPKTGRFEVFAGLGTSLNDPFFSNFEGSLRFGYNFTEHYGVEGLTTVFGTAAKDVVRDLQALNVSTTSLVVPRRYFGVDFKFSPVYGKMALNNHSILPFDLYFSAGLGVTNYENGNGPTLHLGTGETFAITKSFALRWDFSWNFYSATAYSDNSLTPNVPPTASTSLYNNLFITLGASFFFPEATYR